MVRKTKKNIEFDSFENLTPKHNYIFNKYIKIKKSILIEAKKFVNKTNYFSKRFAAKEAFVKALGIGFRKGLNFKDIQVANDNLGKPYYLINSRIKSLIKKRKKVNDFNLFLSISDEKEYSIAFTIIQKIS